MDDDGGLGGLGIRNWGYYEQPTKGNLGLQLMSSVTAERDQKPLLGGRDAGVMLNGGFMHRECGVPESTVPMDFIRESWISPRERLLHGFSGHQNYPFLSGGSGAHNSPYPPPPDIPKEEHPQVEEVEVGGKNDAPLKKRANGRACKAPKAKKSKKSSSASKEDSNCSVPRPKPIKNTGVIINGVDIDISGIPIPICSCTGTPQQCYRWGCGGWQSACCTTSISMYPLPLSTKRRGARIAGRKMSQGAFKKVLEKLAAEGYNISHPIDLKTHWAKHGTNKFVTIRHLLPTLLSSFPFPMALYMAADFGDPPLLLQSQYSQ